ncbi:hypothetical protein P4X70_003988 [Salmonella enterica]|nr:hypothetical protein [Salmonella enterica subsp. enterica serovar Typhimurium]EDN6661538.1 fimbrial protein [Salmonella enterica]EKQ1727754.1 hypothetical protein [Salmonella enterica]
MMKKWLFCLLWFLPVLAQINADAATVQPRGVIPANLWMHVTGNILVRTCEISTDGVIYAHLGGFSRKTVRNVSVDSPVGSIPLEIKLVHCPSDATNTGVMVKFVPDKNHPRYMMNVSADGSDMGDIHGVLMGLTDANDNLLSPGDTVPALKHTAPSSTETVKMNIKVFRTAKTDADITAGLIESWGTLVATTY